MAGRYNYDQNLEKKFQNMERRLSAKALNLGGSSTGLGGPAGGFVGYLPQIRVSYDVDELASDLTPGSGISLLDNLNHIRYRLNILEVSGGGGGISVKEDDVLVASGIVYMNFEGGVDVTDDGGNQVTVTVTASGGVDTDELVKVSSNDTTADYLFNKVSAGAGISLAVTGEGSDESLEITSSGGTDELVKVSSNDTVADYLYNKITPGTGIDINVINEAGNEQVEIVCTVVPSGGSSYYPTPTVPDVGDFTWVNQETATAENSYAGIYIYAPPDIDQNFRMLKKAAPTVPYIIDAQLLLQFHNVDNNKGGLFFMEEATGYLHAYLLTNQNSMMLSSKLWSPTSWNDNYGAGVNINPLGSIIFLRIEDDNSNRICSWSTDGVNFIEFHSISRSDWFVADKVGFFVESQNATYGCGMTVLSWYEH